MIEQSPTIGKLATALVEAQKAMPIAKKDSENPHFKSKYADLANVVEASTKCLTDNGLSILQLPISYEDGRVGVTTMLMHTSGEWIKGTVAIPQATASNPQHTGSIIQYFRRYARMGAIGMAASEEDDDGESGRKASEGNKSEPHKEGEPVKSGTGDTAPMLRLIHVLMRKKNLEGIDGPESEKKKTEYAEILLTKSPGTFKEMKNLSWAECKTLIDKLQKEG